MKIYFSFPGILCTVLLAVGCMQTEKANSEQSNETTQAKTFPKTGSVDRLSPLLDQIIAPGEQAEIIAEGFEWSEGPLWLPEQKMLIFSDIPNNSIFQWSESSGLKLYLKPAGYTDTVSRGGETGSNGLLLDGNGRLVLCQHGDRRMAWMDAPLDQPEPNYVTLVDRWDGKRFNSPNDAVFSKSGDLFFTDPAYGLEKRYQDPSREMDFTGVFRLDTKGNISLLTDQMSNPNGIGLSPDESSLYVANSGGGELSYWMVYNLEEDGTIGFGEKFCDASAASDSLRGAPDGLVVREDGIIFATGPGGVWILDPEGEHLGLVKTGQATANCTLDSDGNYLYMTADMYLMRIKLL